MTNPYLSTTKALLIPSLHDGRDQSLFYNPVFIDGSVPIVDGKYTFNGSISNRVRFVLTTNVLPVWTAQMRINLTSVSVYSVILNCKRAESDSNSDTLINVGVDEATMRIKIDNGQVSYLTSNTVLSLNTDYFIEIAYGNGTLYLFVNGQVDTVLSGAQNFSNMGKYWFLGITRNSGYNFPFTGTIDSFRLSRGILHTSNYTVPTLPFVPEIDDESFVYKDVSSDVTLTATDRRILVQTTGTINVAMPSLTKGKWINIIARNGAGSAVNLNFPSSTVVNGLTDTIFQLTTTSDEFKLLKTSSTNEYITIPPNKVIGASVTPLTILGSSVLAWYRGDSIVTSGTNITQLVDKSGNSNHATQATVANQAQILTSALNGKTAINFDYLDCFYNMPNILTTISGNQATLIVVFKLKDLTRHWDLAWTGSTTDSYWGTNSFFGYSGYLGEFRSNRLEANPPNMTVTTPQYLEISSGASNYTVYRGGTSIFSGTPAWGVTSTPRIGKGADGKKMNGWVGEFILVNRVLTNTERTQISQYINAYWGI